MNNKYIYRLSLTQLYKALEQETKYKQYYLARKNSDILSTNHDSDREYLKAIFSRLNAIKQAIKQANN
jgi:hypothetical protein